MSRPPASRAQLAVVLVSALAVSLGLMGLRSYPWSLATVLGVAIGVLIFSSWNTVRRLHHLHRSRSEEDESRVESASETTRRR